MADKISIDKEKVAQIAMQLDTCTKRLRNTLEDCNRNVRFLRGAWQGSAADKIIDECADFYISNISEYGAVMRYYVDFLSKNVVHGYITVEEIGVSMGTDFK